MAQYQPQGISPNGRPYSVIIAEPSKFQLKQLQQILESEGYKIIGIAETGRDLINMYKENRLVDLIFMEVSLPVMDGYAAFWEMKEQGGILPKIFFISEENSSRQRCDRLHGKANQTRESFRKSKNRHRKSKSYF